MLHGNLKHLFVTDLASVFVRVELEPLAHLGAELHGRG